MSDTVKTLLLLILLLLAYLSASMGVNWWARRIGIRMVRELEQRQAFGPASAVSLSTRKAAIGLRDYRPQVLLSLIQSGVITQTEDGRCYLTRGRPLGGTASRS